MLKLRLMYVDNLFQRNLDAPQTSNNQHGALSEIDTLTHQTAFTSLEEDDEKLYCRYPCKRRKQNETLPIFREKDKVNFYFICQS